MKNKMVSLESEEMGELLGWIRHNGSPAVEDVKRRARKVLVKNGYELEEYVRKEGMWYSFEYRPIPKETIKPRRIVSPGRNPISDEKIAEIKRMHLEGLSGREIARRLKIGEKTVRKYIGKFKKMENYQEEQSWIQKFGF